MINKKKIMGTTMKTFTVFLFLLFISIVNAIEYFTTDRGLRTVISENHSNKITALKFFCGMGTILEDSNKRGISEIIMRMLLKGTEHRNGYRLVESIESLGGKISTDLSDDYAVITITVLSKYTEEAIDILSDIILYSQFQNPYYFPEREKLLSEIQARPDQHFQFGLISMKTNLYGYHPYRNDRLGESRTIKRFVRKDLVLYYRDHFTAKNSVLAVVGDINTEQVKESIKKKFVSLETGKNYLAQIKRDAPELPEKEEIIDEKKSNYREANIFIGYLGANVFDSTGYFSLKLLNNMIGGGMSSKLFVELREKKGIGYSVFSFFPTRYNRSFFTIYTGCQPEQAIQAKNIIIGIVNDIKAGKISNADIEKAKKLSEADYLVQHQSMERRAFYLGWYELLGLPHDFDTKFTENLKSITMDELVSTARKYLKNPVIYTVAP